MVTTRSISQNDEGAAVGPKCTACEGLLEADEVNDGQTICDSCAEEAKRVKSNAAGVRRVQARGGGMVQLADTRMAGSVTRSAVARDDRAGGSGGRAQQSDAALGGVGGPRSKRVPIRLIEEEPASVSARQPAAAAPLVADPMPPSDNTRCVACGGLDGEGTPMLLRDGNPCTAGWHISCLNPALNAVPLGDWFCPCCSVMRGDVPEPQAALTALGQALDATTDIHCEFKNGAALKNLTSFIASDECAAQIVALAAAPSSTGTFYLADANDAFAKALIMMLRLHKQLPRDSPADGVMQREFMQIPQLLLPRIGGQGVGEASKDATTKACIKRCELLKHGRLKKLYADSLKDGTKLRGGTPTMGGGPLLGPVSGPVHPTDARAPGSNLAEYLLHLTSTQDPAAPPDGADLALMRRLIRGAGATDAGVWPQGSELINPSEYLARIRRGGDPPEVAVTRARAPAPREGGSSPETVQKATRYLESGCLGKAKALLCSSGLATHDARGELLDKHPAGDLPSTASHPPEQWLHPGSRGAPHLRDAEEILTNAALRSAVKGSKKGTCPDFLGWRIRECLGLFFDTADEEVISTFRTRIAEPFLTGIFPEGSFEGEFLYGATLLATSKAPKPGSRPIAIGAALRRLCLKAVIPGLNDDASEYFTNAHSRVVQLAGGVEDGAVRAFKTIEALLEQLRIGAIIEDPDNPCTPLDPEDDTISDPVIASTTDRINAFNSMGRQALLDSLAGVAGQDYDLGMGEGGVPGVVVGDELKWTTEAFNPLNAHIKAAYGKGATLQHHSRASGTFLHISGTRGVQQGDVVASLMFCAAMHPIICRVLERHPEVYAVCFADNVYLVGRASAVLPAQVDLDRHLLQDLGVASKPSEAYVYAPIWDEAGLGVPPQAFSDLAGRSKCPGILSGFRRESSGFWAIDEFELWVFRRSARWRVTGTKCSRLRSLPKGSGS